MEQRQSGQPRVRVVGVIRALSWSEMELVGQGTGGVETCVVAPAGVRGGPDLGMLTPVRRATRFATAVADQGRVGATADIDNCVCYGQGRRSLPGDETYHARLPRRRFTAHEHMVWSIEDISGWEEQRFR